MILELLYLLLISTCAYPIFLLARRAWIRADVDEKIRSREEVVNIAESVKDKLSETAFTKAREARNKIKELVDSDY